MFRPPERFTNLTYCTLKKSKFSRQCSDTAVIPRKSAWDECEFGKMKLDTKHQEKI